MPVTRTKASSGPTLTNITSLGRNVVKYGVIVLVVLIVGRVFLSAIVSYWKATHPPPPPPPTVGFGKLPRLSFPTKDEEEKPRSYRLETASGKTPLISDRATVYLMPKSVPSLLADERVKEVAATYNFIFQPEVISNSTYRWTKSQPLEMSLQINVLTLNFSMKSDYLTRPELLSKIKMPESFEAVNRVKSFLSQAGLLKVDIATSSGQVTFLKSLGGELSIADSLSDADFVKVDIDRLPIDGRYQMYGPKKDMGVVSGIITGALSSSSSIVELEYHYYNVDYSQVETYPIRSSKDAWKILQAGEGYIVDKGKLEGAVVRDITLGYYEDWDEQEFLQPIYVFKGDEGFLGYVQAVDPRYIGLQ